MSDDEERVEVEVRDTGRGISDEDLDQVFQQGWSTKRGWNGAGTGFGLALTRLVCRRRGGDVTAWSNRGRSRAYGRPFCRMAPITEPST